MTAGNSAGYRKQGQNIHKQQILSTAEEQSRLPLPPPPEVGTSMNEEFKLPLNAQVLETAGTADTAPASHPMLMHGQLLVHQLLQHPPNTAHPSPACQHLIPAPADGEDSNSIK